MVVVAVRKNVQKRCSRSMDVTTLVDSCRVNTALS